METLSQLSKKTSDYIKTHWNNGGTSEFDKSINDISRATIDAMKKELGDCWLFKINRHPEDKDKPFMVQYTGQKVYNFEYSAIVPCYDKKLEELLIENSKVLLGEPCRVTRLLLAIEERIYSLKGMYLIWS